MSNDKRQLDKLKDNYNKIEIPESLDSVVQSAIERGKADMKKERSNGKIILNTCASIAIAFTLFTASVNVSPAFAENFKGIPVLGKLVEILRFVDGEATGGTITDGSDVNEMVLVEDEKADTIIINFANGGVEQNLAAHYDISYETNPYTMTFAISGVRMLSAAKDFEAIKSSKYVKDVYTIMTLDDSMVRFVVEFNGPVSYEVKEMMDPASLLLKLKADDSVEDSKLYSVRTVSYSFGESIGHIEEKLKDYANLRVLKDQEGTFAVEVGLFESENEAERILRELNQDFDIDFFIEARMGNDEPTGKGIQDNLDAENPDDEAESGDTADKDSKIEVDEESGFSVSVTENSNQFYGVVMLNETGIEIYDEYMEKVELSFSYKEVKLSKLHGEASFILQIEKGDRVINVSGVYSDFFEKLDTYWSID